MEQFRVSLKSARVNAGLTQAEVAQNMQVSKTTVINWEKYRKSPTVKEAIKLAKLYNTDFDNIFFNA